MSAAFSRVLLRRSVVLLVQVRPCPACRKPSSECLLLSAATFSGRSVGRNDETGIDVVDRGLRILGSLVRRCSRSRSVSRVDSASSGGNLHQRNGIDRIGGDGLLSDLDRPFRCCLSGRRVHRTNVEGALHLAIGILRSECVGRSFHLCRIGLGRGVLVSLQFFLRFCLQTDSAGRSWAGLLPGAAGLSACPCACPFGWEPGRVCWSGPSPGSRPAAPP